MASAIRKIQNVLHEPETGEYDDRMDDVLSKPRCGRIQPYNETDALSNATMHKRYILWGPKWDHTALTYSFVNYTSDVKGDLQKATLKNAFAQWTQFLPITISPAPDNARADIHIMFRSMGSAEPAYAFTNMIADGIALSSGLINITFNDDYVWTDDRLFNFTAIHEIGHTLGLSHSKVENAVMWPYYEADVIRQIHPDDQAAVHSLYGWRTPRWKRIDNNSGTKDIVQLSSAGDPTPLDGLYQLRSSGQILWNDRSGKWVNIDNNKDTVQIAGSGGNLYQRHTDGSIYKYLGSGANWQYIGAATDNSVDIVASGDQIYQRRKDGWIARWSGTGLAWTTIAQPSTPVSKQIAVSDKKTLWNLLSSGDVVRSEWPYGSNSWAIVDHNLANAAIAVGGEEFYKLQTDGSIIWLDLRALLWKIIENEGSIAIQASGNYLYSRHDDGSIWRYTGTPMLWEQLDASMDVRTVVGDSRGAVWAMLGTGDIMQLSS
ncbi:zincin [Polyplosphaeria fusca]|uniref:Zincin n=1 Tax=Polyplosphaeria fusca TaxID=682080 RepID=A0A9P4QKV4_9PLEO|nr:zincin [Polyplosphaeria fusca]